MNITRCNICGSSASSYQTVKLLGKYNAPYLQCNNCQFIFSPDPYWLPEAYGSAITKLDIGLVQRNELMSDVVSAVIKCWSKKTGKFIDYGGGYGMLVRMLRDRGFNYYRQDIHCENLFAESFDVTDVPDFKADLLTAFEVFEHLQNPSEELERMLIFSDNILFSTTLQPHPNVTPDSWWYFTPDTGQHIALYSEKSLYELARRHNLNYYRGAKEVHLFTKKRISGQLFNLITHPRAAAMFNRIIPNPKSLLPSDFRMVQAKLQTVLNQAL